MKLADWMAWQGELDASVAEKCGVDRVTINRIRRGVNRPSWPLIRRIREITLGEVKAEDFMGGNL